MQDFLFFRSGRKYLKINLGDILFIQAEKRYVIIVTAQKNYLSFISISEIEKILPANLFCRIHRSFIISLLHTDSFDSELAYLGNRKIPIAEQYKSALKNAIVVIHSRIEQINLETRPTNPIFLDVYPQEKPMPNN